MYYYLRVQFPLAVYLSPSLPGPYWTAIENRFKLEHKWNEFIEITEEEYKILKDIL